MLKVLHSTSLHSAVEGIMWALVIRNVGVCRYGCNMDFI